MNVVESIQQRAQETSTTGLVVWHNDRRICGFGEEKKVPLYSLTKSIVSLAIGFLFDEGKIQSFDTPISQWFTDWQKGPKACVTLRMLLTHTSGIADHFIEMDGQFNQQKFAQFKDVQGVIDAALKLDVIKEPGTHASYSNSSADILVALVNTLATMRIDRYVSQKLFGPLAITDWQWVSSTKQLFGVDDDVPSGADGLVLAAEDLLKIGKMILHEGVYEGKRVLSAKWIAMMTGDVPKPALTLQLGTASLTNNVDPLHPEKYLPATDMGHEIPLERYCSALFWLTPEKSRDAFLGWGFLGQYLIVVPAKNIVAVRLYNEGLPNLAAVEDNTRVSFADFEYWVRKL